jgi:prepilin-type N-terminal cleavage/methylation domain-containing protein
MKKGFTLTELLVVIGIIAVLSGIAIPLVTSSIDKGRQVACINNLRQIGIGIESYLQDHNDTMPNVEMARANKEDKDTIVLETALADYITDPEVYHCPSDKKQFEKTGSSYIWNSTQSGRKKNSLNFFTANNEPSSIPLVVDKEAYHTSKSGVNVLYADYTASKEVRFSAAPKEK